MTEDEKILQVEFEKRWKRSPQKDGCLFSGVIVLCLAQALFAPDFPFAGRTWEIPLLALAPVWWWMCWWA